MVQALVGTRVVGAVWRVASRRRLRVLAYHGIGDADRFEQQLRHLVRHYTPVGSTQVLRWLHEHEALPPRAVWVTFDDGVEDVVRLGLPLLQRNGVPATLFVCPGLIDTEGLHWWQAVERAARLGLLDAPEAEVLRRMKAATDEDRRVELAEIELRLAATAAGVSGAQLTSDDLRAWLAAGNDLGNHSFDHPRLDRCVPADQEQQVRRAHEWLEQFLDDPPRLFAWPDGDPADAALRTLRTLEYEAVLVCDHRLVSGDADAMALSRLRIDADASVDRFRSVVSGAHPAFFAAQQKVRARLRGRH